jgi:glycosyltransferase involved in cell wall biosynthesis
LAWRQAGGTQPPQCITPKPGANLLWESNNPRPATAAICISLFNYADRIETALNSAHAQTHRDVELVVVDDASTDHGLAQVQTWLSENAERFNRVLLIQHQQNAGLAAARNTAFTHAHAEWCFVLDADNALRPTAVSNCLAIAAAAPLETAVVHPLVEVISEESWNDQRSLISGRTWQQQVLKRYNVIDAMALIRRSAWASVGGYEHILHGWEDYDFWCKLIESGFHGVLCPQRLATYHSHGESMMNHSTLPHLRKISRILQQRHPWLDLPYAKGIQEGWVQ